MKKNIFKALCIKKNVKFMTENKTIFLFGIGCDFLIQIIDTIFIYICYIEINLTTILSLILTPQVNSSTETDTICTVIKNIGNIQI